jgi:hypothetical protein
VLAAKAIVIGAITFVAGLAAAIIVVSLGVHILRGNGNDVQPVTQLTRLRVIVGTAALLALFAILALALGAVFRRRLAAVIAIIAVIVVPYVVALALVLTERMASVGRKLHDKSLRSWSLRPTLAKATAFFPSALSPARE